MIKLNKKSGFSLAESLISMMLLVLTIMLSMAGITRKKHHQKTITNGTISGMYACWNDGSARYEYYCTGNRCEKTKKENLEADKFSYIFKKDRRVNYYYIYAVGSRYCESNKCVDGQVIFEPHRSINDPDEDKMKFGITLGDSSKSPSDNKGNTVIMKERGGSEALTKALGGLEQTESGLIFKNIKKCKYIKNSPCEDGEKTNCDITKDEDNDGFATLNLYCNNNPKCHLKDIKKVSGDVDKYTGKCATYQTIEDAQEEVNITTNTIVKVVEEDSSFKATTGEHHAKDSEFVKKLKMLPVRYRNGLYNDLLNYYMGDDGAKDGVVLIIW